MFFAQFSALFIMFLSQDFQAIQGSPVRNERPPLPPQRDGLRAAHQGKAVLIYAPTVAIKDAQIYKATPSGQNLQYDNDMPKLDQQTYQQDVPMMYEDGYSTNREKPTHDQEMDTDEQGLRKSVSSSSSKKRQEVRKKIARAKPMEIDGMTQRKRGGGPF